MCSPTPDSIENSACVYQLHGFVSDCLWCSVAPGMGQQDGAEEFGAVGEVVGGFWGTAFRLITGCGVEALEFDAALHVVALDDAAERVDERLRIDGVVGRGLGAESFVW